MKQGNWNYIKEKIQEEDNNIFEGFNKTNLNDYEKRKIIFNYLCSNITYDYIAYIDILLKRVRSKEEVDEYIKEKRITDDRLIRLIYNRYEIKDYIKRRSPVEELLNTIDNHEGLCNSISQYYKLLLEYNDIYSVCVICDNLSLRNHQINLVYSKDNDTYSFDDISTAITSKELKDKCFDYDLDTAKEINQGIRPVSYLSNIKAKEFDSFGVILSSEIINYYIGRKDNSYLIYGLENNSNVTLPDNIISRKKHRGEHNENTYRYKKSW